MRARKPIFQETAIRDATGRVWRTGMIHDPGVLPRSAKLSPFEAGFVDRRGRFLERMKAGAVAHRYDRRFGPAAKVYPAGSGESDSLRFRGLMTPDEETRFARRNQAGRLRAKRQAARKSAGGGDVQVSAYDRNGHPVSAYTRSRPTR